MAVSRYIAICHPLRARQIIGKTFTVASLLAVFVVSVLFNVPRFLRDEPRNRVDVDGRRNYFAYPGPLKLYPDARLAYSWTYFILGIVVPFCVLIFCNAHLVWTLRTTMLQRRDASFRRTVSPATPRRTARQRSEQATHRITLTLVVIIVLYVILFIPSELLNLYRTGRHDQRGPEMIRFGSSGMLNPYSIYRKLEPTRPPTRNGLEANTVQEAVFASSPLLSLIHI